MEDKRVIIKVTFQVADEGYAQGIVEVMETDDLATKIAFASLIRNINEDDRLIKLWDEAKLLVNEMRN